MLKGISKDTQLPTRMMAYKLSGKDKKTSRSGLPLRPCVNRVPKLNRNVYSSITTLCAVSTTAISHVATVFSAMFGITNVAFSTWMSRAVHRGTAFCSRCQMVFAVVAIASVGFIDRTDFTMFGAGLIFCTWMFCAMFGTIMVARFTMHITMLRVNNLDRLKRHNIG
jgi:hypothetical protein